MKTNLFLIFFLLLSSSSCNDRNSSKTDFDFIPKDSLKIEKNSIYTKYQIPLPIEIFQILVKNAGFNAELLKPYPNYNKEYSSTENAFYLGVYSADLAYCTFLENGQKTIDYSNICSFFTKKINIEDVYDKNYIERLKENINNQDSLIIITNKAYTKSCNLLENRGMKNIIPFTIYGGWIETIYLAFFTELKDTNNIEKFRDEIIKKTKISNLISYLYDVQIESSAYYYNKDLKKLIFDLIDLEKLFKEGNLKENSKKIENKIEDLYKLYKN